MYGTRSSYSDVTAEFGSTSWVAQSLTQHRRELTAEILDCRKEIHELRSEMITRESKRTEQNMKVVVAVVCAVTLLIAWAPALVERIGR